jgi:prevent-host-death family protein
MRSVKVHEAKTNLSKLLARVERGEDVVIARGKTPVARLVAIGTAQSRRRPGVLRGKLRVGREFFAPLPPDELSGWE